MPAKTTESFGLCRGNPRPPASGSAWTQPTSAGLLVGQFQHLAFTKGRAGLCPFGCSDLLLNARPGFDARHARRFIGSPVLARFRSAADRTAALTPDCLSGLCWRRGGAVSLRSPLLEPPALLEANSRLAGNCLRRWAGAALCLGNLGKFTFILLPAACSWSSACCGGCGVWTSAASVSCCWHRADPGAVSGWLAERNCGRSPMSRSGISSLGTLRPVHGAHAVGFEGLRPAHFRCTGLL